MCDLKLSSVDWIPGSVTYASVNIELNWNILSNRMQRVNAKDSFGPLG